MAQTGDRGLLVQSTEGEEEKRMGKDEDEIVVITIDEEDNGSVANNENLSLITNKDLNNTPAATTPTCKQLLVRTVKFVAVSFAAIGIVLLCAWFAYEPKDSDHLPPLSPKENEPKGNDTWSPLILISIDGFRPEYLERSLTPNLNRLCQEGLRADHLISQFPTKTFPNHYSIVTGLYPESHGIVSNSFYDPLLNDSFFYQSDRNNQESKWWGGEPIWVSAVKQDKKAFTAFWPGSEAEIGGRRPTKYLPYSMAKYMTEEDRVNSLLNWLDVDRPDLITLYFSDVDVQGHSFGPRSAAVNASLVKVDQAIGKLMHGLTERKLLDRANVMIVSDHGMTEVDKDKLVVLTDYVDRDSFNLTDGTPVALILPRNENMTDSIYEKLLEGSQGQHWSVYKREEIPEKFHFRNNRRIPPIIAIADLHYSLLMNKTEIEYFGGGMHGYDNLIPDMFSIFIARGPAFKSSAGGLVTPPLQNIDLYNVMARIMGINAAPNNGSLGTVDLLLR